MNCINLFNPFRSKPEWYEDRLTWGFLVALKYDPFLQNFLREMVESQLLLEHREYSNIWEPVPVWEPAYISTQVSEIDSDPATNPIVHLVSVLLTDVRIQEEVKVKWSSRTARYDGVIKYPNGLTLIVENKPSHGNIRKEQLSPSRDSFLGDIDDVKLHKSAVCLEWSEILEGVLKYANSNVATFGSSEIAQDFLSLVEELHPNLTPYRTFELCGDRPEALNRRVICLLDAIKEKASESNLECRGGRGSDVPYLFRGESKIAQRVMMSVKEGKLQVTLAPADTVTQADAFFCNVDREAFLSLESRNWKVKRNLRFHFKGVPLDWLKTKWDTCKYFDRFFDSSLKRAKKLRSVSEYGRKNRDESLDLAKRWEEEGLILSEGRESIENQFKNTKRPFLDFAPGFTVTRQWDLAEVIELERQGKLVEHIIDELAIPLATWGEEL